MSDDFVAPIKGICKAFENGIRLGRTIARSAGDASNAQALQISDSARTLQKALDKDAKAVSNAYRQGLVDCGPSFSDTLVDDKQILSRLKDLRIDLLDQINDCPDFDEDTESFDPKPFNELQKQSKLCSAECLEIFSDVRAQLIQAGLQEFQLNDRAQLSSISPPAKSLPPVPPKPTTTLDRPLIEPSKPKSPWSLGLSMSTLDTDPVSPARSTTRPLSGEISPLNEETPRLIPREVISNRLSVNDDFLERRRQSRILWQDQYRQSSVSPFSESLRTGSEPLISPIIGPSMVTESPADTPSRFGGSSAPPAMVRDRSQTSHGTRSSTTSSLLREIAERPRQDSTNSQESIFGLRTSAPLSPPLSEHRTSGPEWGTLATTLRVPGFGTGVEDGLEVVSPVDHDNGLILVNENQVANQSTPATSIKSIDHPMRHDASFYRYGGFCEGAKTILKGDSGFRIVKRPSGTYSATISARCIKCAYEVGYKDVEKDERLDQSGIYGNCGIRWRQRFIIKSHLRTNAVEEPLYACIFCIEEHKTVEEHDATVFFSVSSLFRHLATHPRPLPTIHGITTVYGVQPPAMVDFDVHFTLPEPTPSEFSMSEIAHRIATRPSAYATTTHHPKSKQSSSTDPEGNPSLHFASGARIVGISFPNRFRGEWCTGYHDGQRGSFPASAIMLDAPTREDVLMSPKSNLVATAKWDFKPRDAKEGGWLKFSRGDRITNIGYTFQDQWCWSGQTSKGKWGLFPAVFVEGLKEGSGIANISTSPNSSRSSVLGGFSNRINSFGVPLRKPTSGKAERSASIRSNGSEGSMIRGRIPNAQPGLEVAPTSGSWRGS